MWGEDWGTMVWGVGAQVPTLGPLGWLLLGALMGAAAVLHRRPLSKASRAVALIVVGVVPLAAAAVTLPHTFANGTLADANEVNANFSALATRFGENTSEAGWGTGTQCTLGQVWLTAGFVANGRPAEGQVLSIQQNSSLFALLGTMYGGDGETTFALPDLRDVAPSGLTYVICVNGVFPTLL